MMKKTIAIFLAAFLLLCQLVSIASAASVEDSGGSTNTKKQEGGFGDDFSSGGNNSSDDFSPRKTEGYGENPENGLRIGDATAVIQGIRADEKRIHVTILYRNDSSRANSYSDLFWLNVSQAHELLNREMHSGGVMISRRALQNGDSAEFTLDYDLNDGSVPVQIDLEPFREGEASPVTLWYDPLSGKSGSWEELGLTEDRLIRTAEPLITADPSRLAGQKDGSIGNDTPPQPERFSHPMRAYMTFKDGGGKYRESGVLEIAMNEAGQYTLNLSQRETVSGISFLSISVANPKDSGDPADPANLTGRSIRIDEILVDGKEVSFQKSATVLKETVRQNSDAVINRRLSTDLYFADRAFDLASSYRFWDGDTTTVPQENNVDPADFASFQTLSVTFSYGKFD